MQYVIHNFKLLPNNYWAILTSYLPVDSSSFLESVNVSVIQIKIFQTEYVWNVYVVTNSSNRLVKHKELLTLIYYKIYLLQCINHPNSLLWNTRVQLPRLSLIKWLMNTSNDFLPLHVLQQLLIRLIIYLIVCGVLLYVQI